VQLEVRKGEQFAEREVDVIADELTEVALELHAAVGRIFVRTGEKELTVFLDGKELGEVGEGLFKEIPPGTHSLELRSENRYWKGTVEVEIGATTEVEADPVGLGTVAYRIPEEATAVVSGNMYEAKLKGSGEERLPEGAYDVIVSGTYYETLQSSLSVRPNITTTFEPELEFAETDEAAGYLAELRIKDLETRRGEIRRELRGLRGGGGWRTAGWITGGIAAGGLVASGVFTVLGIMAKSAYDEATDSFTAIDKRQDVEGCNLGLTISGSTTLALGTAAAVFFMMPGELTPEEKAKKEALLDELSAVETEIEALKEDPRGGLK
jgi:hypothetical protein